MQIKSTMNKIKKITVAITGASGSIYAKRLIQRLDNNNSIDSIHLVFSKNGRVVTNHETGEKWLEELSSKVKVIDNSNFFSPIASGSNCDDAMVVIPCSMGMLARVASGVSEDLISRSCDVILKERKKLILVIRETPYNLIHIENMKTVTLAGGIITPASPSFYREILDIESLVDSVIERIESLLDIESPRYKWAKE